VIAGGVTFYIMLALIPAVGVFVSVYGLFADVSQVDGQLGELAAFVPPEVLAIIRPQMTRLASETPDTLSLAFLVSLLLSLWTASLGMRVMVEALNVAYEEVERRNVLLRFALTYLLTFAALVFFVVVTAVMAAVPLALEWLRIGGLLIPLRWVLLFAIVASSFAVFYRFGPSRTRPRWRWVHWGALFAAVIWMGGSLGYSWYVNTVARFDVTYGPLGALVGFLFWIWFSVMAVLLGAELNAEIEHQTAVDTTVGEPKPMGARGAAVADSVGLAFQGLHQLWRKRPRLSTLMRRVAGPWRQRLIPKTGSLRPRSDGRQTPL
jgi:membrane protein